MATIAIPEITWDTNIKRTIVVLTGQLTPFINFDTSKEEFTNQLIKNQIM
jgi:hypothetical protein